MLVVDKTEDVKMLVNYINEYYKCVFHFKYNGKLRNGKLTYIYNKDINCMEHYIRDTNISINFKENELIISKQTKAYWNLHYN